MSVIKRQLTQAATDTAKELVIETGLTASGKQGWAIMGMRVTWTNANTAALNDSVMSVSLQTASGALHMSSADVIEKFYWVQAQASTAAIVAITASIERMQVEQRVTVQPELIIRLDSAATSQQNDIAIELYYEPVKLTDIEVLRMLQGGA